LAEANPLRPTLLLDTHVLLWWLADDPRLTPTMRDGIADPSTAVLVSAASAWEAASKAAVGKLTVPDGLRQELERQGFDELPVTVEDGLAAGALPRHHADPFDRMLIAQAARRRLVVVTADRRFADYDVVTLA
jgi:PIN domain nuclease of toxin-antitoxin system